jgi:O-antigen chain-terminating methyltransferase
MENNFYRAFQDEFRGSEALIRDRLGVYKPVLEVLESERPAFALDFGSGRGEWLKVLRDFNIQSIGVEIDNAMHEYTVKEGLNVTQSDALTFIRNQESDSVDLISAFHLLEHLNFEHYHEFIQESFRVLNDGGFLILETPNSENISVGTSGFWGDPTHIQPIPKNLLDFICRSTGFGHVYTLLLQHSMELQAGGKVSLHQVLVGVSPDYGIVARKTENQEHSRIHFDSKASGISLQTLAERYDCEIVENYSKLEKEIDSLRFKLDLISNSKPWRLYSWIAKKRNKML